MKIQNKSFNGSIKSRGYEYDPISDAYYKMSIINKPEELRTMELIGLMTIFLLDNGLCLEKFEDSYYVYDLDKVTLSKDENLFTALKDAIEGMQE